MNTTAQKILEKKPIVASTPCRVDMGGTLDISTFYYTLQHLMPSTVNVALDLRTRVSLFPYRKGYVKISSKGFSSATYTSERVPFKHPLGLMFAIGAFFRADGIHIDIASGSPPRSALGGSSVAAVALVAAFSELQSQRGLEPALNAKDIAVIAQSVEESVAGVPCGFQDQLAAVYGGVNAWQWQALGGKYPFRRKVLVARQGHKRLRKKMLVAYCGIPHESKDINGRWVQQFLSGKRRSAWSEIADLTRRFALALSIGDYPAAADLMNRETTIRRRLTPDVLDPVGVRLVKAARRHNCGARFTGAGGGGCLWAIGQTDAIGQLRGAWRKIIASRSHARLLDCDIDCKGLVVGDP